MAKAKSEKKAPRAKRAPHVLAVDPARPWAGPEPLQPSGGPSWTLWIPDDRPRPKGNHKRMALNRATGRMFPIGDPKEQAHELALRDAIRQRVADAPGELATLAGPMAGRGVRLDMVVDLPLPALDAEHGPAWRTRALGGDPTAAPGAVEDGTPDRGNLAKMAEDACANVFGFVNDRQVQGGEVGKRWSTSPGWHLRITRMGGR